MVTPASVTCCLDFVSARTRLRNWQTVSPSDGSADGLDVDASMKSEPLAPELAWSISSSGALVMMSFAHAAARPSLVCLEDSVCAKSCSRDDSRSVAVAFDVTPADVKFCSRDDGRSVSAAFGVTPADVKFCSRDDGRSVSAAFGVTPADTALSALTVSA